MPRFDPTAALRAGAQGAPPALDDVSTAPPRGSASPGTPRSALRPSADAARDPARRSFALSPDPPEASADAETEQETIDRLSLLGEYLTAQRDEPFDAATYLAARQYMARHEANRLAAQHLRNTELISPAELATMSTSEKIHVALVQPFTTRAGRVVMAVVVVLVLITIVAIIVESLPWYQPEIFPDQVLSWTILDGAISNIFLGEMILTILTHPPPRRKIILSLRTFVDVLSILPFYIQLMVASDRRNVLGMLKALRVLRLGKLLMRVDAFLVILLAMKKSAKMLLAPLMACLVALLILSTAVYFSERGQYDPVGMQFLINDCRCEATSEAVLGKKYCPKLESHHFSIPHTMWLMVQTITTVGYGDLLPVCPMGQILTIVGMIFGSLVLSIPIAVVGSYYSVLQFEKQERLKQFKRSLTKHSSSSSFATLNTTDDVSANLANFAGMAAAQAAVGPQSAAEGLLAFLRTNVKSAARPRPPKHQRADYAEDDLDAPRSALTHFNLYHPNDEVMHYVDLYLHDFAEELVLHGRDTQIPKEIAQLIPMSALSTLPESLKYSDDFSVPPAIAKGSTLRTPTSSAILKQTQRINLGAVKDDTTFEIRRYARLGDDVLSPHAARRAQIRAAMTELRDAKRTRKKMAFGDPDGNVSAGPMFYPGIYSASLVARLVISYVHRSSLEAEGDVTTHASLRHGTHSAQSSAAMKGNRVVSVRFLPLPKTENGVSASAVRADSVGYVAEPYTARPAGNALPALAAHTLRMAYTSAAYGAAGGHVNAARFRGNTTASSSRPAANERHIYPGNVVAAGESTYRYLSDDSDLENAVKAFDCALFDIQRKRTGAQSAALFGMPVGGLALRDMVPGKQPSGSGATPTSSLRRRGTSPRSPSGEPSPYARRAGVADDLRHAHTAGDGELQMPFLSPIAAAASGGTSSIAQAAEAQRRARMRQLARSPSESGSL
jgi:hypothetical protein